jgi:hypothetical protein
MSSSLTCRKTSSTINVTNQSFKYWSPMLFLSLFFIKFIVENVLSMFSVATCSKNTNLRTQFNKWKVIGTILWEFNQDRQGASQRSVPMQYALGSRYWLPMVVSSNKTLGSATSSYGGGGATLRNGHVGTRSQVTGSRRVILRAKHAGWLACVVGSLLSSAPSKLGQRSYI